MKPTLQVIRVEHPNDGLGVWRSQNSDGFNIILDHSEFYRIMDVHSDTDVFPGYRSDKELNSQINHDDLQAYKFAFHSIDQLNVAFTPNQLKELINKFGFSVYIISTTDYFKSSFQVVFKDYETKEDISSLFL